MIKHLYRTSLIVICILFVLGGCSPVNIITNEVSPEVTSGHYQTFNFYDVKVNAPDASVVRQDRVTMLKDAIRHELEAVGLQKSDDPDLWVNIGVLVENKEQTRETDLRDAPVYIGQRNYHWESQEIVVNTYRKGTVTIDLIDAETNEMVGQSIASGIIADKDEKLKKRIDEGMEKLFDELWTGSK